MKEHDLIKGIFVIVRGSGTESNESSEIMFKEKKGKFDIVSCHNVCTANFRYPTCNNKINSFCGQWYCLCNFYKAFHH
jgi:hypothetical protein